MTATRSRKRTTDGRYYAITLLHPRDRIHRIVFKGYEGQFTMELRGPHLGDYGNVQLSVGELQQMRNAIDGLLSLHTTVQ